MGLSKAALGQVECAGQLFDLAFRLRQSGLNSPDRVAAIATEAGISPILLRTLIPFGEQLGWWTVARDADLTPISVTEVVPAPADLVQETDKVLRVVGVTDVEKAALVLLRETTLRPMLKNDAPAEASPLTPASTGTGSCVMRGLCGSIGVA